MSLLKKVLLPIVDSIAGKTIMHQRKAVRYKRKFKICQNDVSDGSFFDIGPE